MTSIRQDHSGEEGYLLIGLVVACFLILLTLSIAAPRVAKELERDREVESEHRALEYVRAIQLYYKKNNAYPTSVEQLLGTGTTGVTLGGAGAVKYLRQKYKDPITGGDYRLIHQGEAQTEVKGFFGEPLQGAAPGAAIGGAVNPGAAATAIGGSTPGSAVQGNNSGFSLGSPATGQTQTGTGTSIGSPTSTTGGTGSSTSGNDATTFQGSKGAIVGVGSNGKGPGLVEWNGSADIAQWEFLYDPRVEALKAKVSILGGSPAANGTGSLGSGFAPVNGTTGLGATGIGGNTPGSAVTGTTGTSTGTTTGSGTTGTPAGTTPPTQ
jgi:hypothetical protein